MKGAKIVAFLFLIGFTLCVSGLVMFMQKDETDYKNLIEKNELLELDLKKQVGALEETRKFHNELLVRILALEKAQVKPEPISPIPQPLQIEVIRKPVSLPKAPFKKKGKGVASLLDTAGIPARDRN